jgi:hypothetical protein
LRYKYKLSVYFESGISVEKTGVGEIKLVNKPTSGDPNIPNGDICCSNYDVII